MTFDRYSNNVRIAVECCLVSGRTQPLLLMLFAKQIVHSLNRVESSKADFNEDCIPIAHGPIPESGEFESFQFTSVLALVADEAGFLVNVSGQVKFLTFIILDSTYKVHGVEVCALFKHGFLVGVVHVYL